VNGLIAAQPTEAPTFELRKLQWGRSRPSGSDYAASLMVLAPIAHHADDGGLSRCTYDTLSLATGSQPLNVSMACLFLA
jgi:hypothetical protein